MSATIADVMNPKLVSLHPRGRCDEALRYLAFLGIHAAPVVDDDRRPVGVLSMADLVGDVAQSTVGDRMSAPALTVSAAAAVGTAEELMATSGFHHLAVVDAAGKAVGFVSAIDLLRARTGRTAAHPSTAPLARCTANDLWSDDSFFERSAIEQVPNAPGHLLLTADDDLVWAESCHDLRRRLTEILEKPSDRIVLFAAGGPLRFRYAQLDGGPHRLLGAQG